MTMAARIGFAEADITPPVGTAKIGWKKLIVSDTVLDPLYAKAAVVLADGDSVGLVQLDTLSIRWTQVNEIRDRVSEEFGFPGSSILVGATHNHAGPAVADAGDVKRDEEYVNFLVERVVEAIGQAIENAVPAEIGMGHCAEFRVGFNRRVVMRDGTVRTHGTFNDPDSLCVEGPIDPEVHVLAARDGEGSPLGCIVNFGCHPAHHGGTTELSGGFPEVVASIMEKRGWPVTIFLDGSSGNVTTVDPARGGYNVPKEEAGSILADDVSHILESVSYTSEVEVGARSRRLELPFRELTRDQLEGTARGAQRFIDSEIYEREMPRLVERVRSMGSQPAEVQAVFVNDSAYIGVPAEFFAELGLEIKERCYPVEAKIVGQANGMVGYVPTAEAFERGGYETTLCGSSRLAPEAGGMLVDGAVELVKSRG